MRDSKIALPVIEPYCRIGSATMYATLHNLRFQHGPFEHVQIDEETSQHPTRPCTPLNADS